MNEARAKQPERQAAVARWPLARVAEFTSAQPVSAPAWPVDAPWCLPAASRLARAIVAGSALAEDLRTLDEWAKGILTSRGTLRARCHAAKAQPRSALAFTRALRAYLAADRTGLCLEDFLDIADSRTLRRFLQRCGERPNGRRVTLAGFCAGQTHLRAPLVIPEVVSLLESCVPDNGRALAATSPAARLDVRPPIAAVHDHR